jgi:methylthioribose-1-phosphate isomerase
MNSNPEQSMPIPRAIQWIGDTDGFLRLIDQTLLPARLEYRDCRSIEEVWEAIRSLRVRGAPAIGIAAAYGVVIGVASSSFTGMVADLERACGFLATSRPTAVNLFAALDRMRRVARRRDELPAQAVAFRKALLAEARTIEEEDQRMCRRIGEAGLDLIGEGEGILTHCNAGALATAGLGTALAPMFLAAELGRRFHVWVDETRPLLQGARLTAWELQQAGIPLTLICDSMAGLVLKEGRVQRVIVGADRIAANGDTANKIGTYSLALLARAHRIPFYVAAPSSTFDRSLPGGDAIPIEQRDAAEVTHHSGKPAAPEGVAVYNPAFDVTPAELITAFITDLGLIQPVNAATIREALG